MHTVMKKLIRQAKEELKDADSYIHCAMTYKQSNPDLSKSYIDIAQDELRHMEILEDQMLHEVERLNRKASESEQSEIDAKAMSLVWDFEHEELTSEWAKIRTKITGYK